MYAIYRIVCFATGKVYVGQTSRMKIRKSEHFSLLRRNKHFNSRLQRAWNKYGEATFFFETLESGLSLDEVDGREKYWITHFDCLNPDKGYNMADGKYSRPDNSKPIIWNGITYPSILEASRQMGVSTTSIHNWLAKGWSGDGDKKRGIYKNMHGEEIKCFWNGVEYPSVSAAAKANNISQTAMAYRIQKGWTCDGDVGQGSLKPCSWNGIQYHSIKEAAKANKVHPRTMWYRFKMGYAHDSDLPHERKG